MPPPSGPPTSASTSRSSIPRRSRVASASIEDASRPKRISTSHSCFARRRAPKRSAFASHRPWSTSIGCARGRTKSSASSPAVSRCSAKRGGFVTFKGGRRSRTHALSSSTGRRTVARRSRSTTRSSRPARVRRSPRRSRSTPTRVITSTGALELPDLPKTLLVVGAGYIGLELGTVYAALGSRVTVVEMADRILSGVDQDLARPVKAAATAAFEALRLGTKVDGIKETAKGIVVRFAGEPRRDDSDVRQGFGRGRSATELERARSRDDARGDR